MSDDQKVTRTMDVIEQDPQKANTFNVSVRYSNDKTLMAIQIETTFPFTGESIAGILNELAANILKEADLNVEQSTSNHLQPVGGGTSTGTNGEEKRPTEATDGPNPSGSPIRTGEGT